MLNIAARLALVVALAAGTVVVLRAADDGDGSQIAGRSRFYNVSVSAPPPGLSVLQAPALTSTEHETFSHRPTIRIWVTESEFSGEVVIDAETGAVLLNSLAQEFSAKGNEVIASIEVHTDLPDVWPFTESSKPPSRISLERLSFTVPSSEAGISIGEVISYCPEPCADIVLRISAQTPMGSFQMDIDAESGEVVSRRADNAALDDTLTRFLADVSFAES